MMSFLRSSMRWITMKRKSLVGLVSTLLVERNEKRRLVLKRRRLSRNNQLKNTKIVIYIYIYSPNIQIEKCGPDQLTCTCYRCIENRREYTCGWYGKVDDNVQHYNSVFSKKGSMLYPSCYKCEACPGCGWEAVDCVGTADGNPAGKKIMKNKQL